MFQGMGQPTQTQPQNQEEIKAKENTEEKKDTTNTQPEE